MCFSSNSRTLKQPFSWQLEYIDFDVMNMAQLFSSFDGLAVIDIAVICFIIAVICFTVICFMKRNYSRYFSSKSNRENTMCSK